MNIYLIKNKYIKMKKCYISLISIFIIAFMLASCELFQMDNYDEPTETLKGEIIDAATGERVLTDQTASGIRVRLRELSWTATEVPGNQDILCMKEGEYQNSKLFAGHYNVRVDGPFVPLVRLSAQGDTLVDESKYIDIKGGVTTLNFEVQPFLKVEWVDKPVVNSDSTITVRIRVTRGIGAEEFREKIEPMGGYNANFLQVSDIRLFVGMVAYIGDSQSDNRYTPASMTYSGNTFEPLLGETITLTSIGRIPAGRTVFVRAAARVRYTTEGVSRYNYNEAIRVDIPR
jgi:hypothetical protein